MFICVLGGKWNFPTSCHVKFPVGQNFQHTFDRPPPPPTTAHSTAIPQRPAAATFTGKGSISFTGRILSRRILLDLFLFPPPPIQFNRNSWGVDRSMGLPVVLLLAGCLECNSSGLGDLVVRGKVECLSSCPCAHHHYLSA